MNEMLTYFDENSLPMDLQYVQKLEGVYNTTMGNFGKRGGCAPDEKSNGFDGIIVVIDCLC
ncbi:hypothetical protein [Brevibacillus porteri]|uniref:hypothetical protein n=1 Tax=Brevibacillus porteri TaxID=2126350 RepID=UPI003D24E573